MQLRVYTARVYPSFFFLDNLGNNVQPPKDVQEKEQFHKLHQWIQGVLRTEHMFMQVQCTRIA